MRFARRKPQRTRRSSTSWIRKTTRFAIYHRDGFDCMHCSGVFPLAEDGLLLTLDHLIPRHAGGSDAPENLITACHACNSTRQHAELPADVLCRLQRHAQKPLNRELGRVYAAVYVACARYDLEHPFTRRKILHVTYDDLQSSLESVYAT